MWDIVSSVTGLLLVLETEEEVVLVTNVHFSITHDFLNSISLRAFEDRTCLEEDCCKDGPALPTSYSPLVCSGFRTSLLSERCRFLVLQGNHKTPKKNRCSPSVGKRCNDITNSAVKRLKFVI